MSFRGLLLACLFVSLRLLRKTSHKVLPFDGRLKHVAKVNGRVDADAPVLSIKQFFYSRNQIGPPECDMIRGWKSAIACFFFFFPPFIARTCARLSQLYQINRATAIDIIIDHHHFFGIR